MNLLTKDVKKALPYKYYFIPILIFTLAGIGDTIYLVLSHYRNYTNISYASFCAISKAINCDTVSQSPWSILLGIPVAFWGVIGYLLFLPFLASTYNNSKTTRPLWSILFILSVSYALSSLFFGYISVQKIHSYCLLCILNYTITFALLFYSWIIRRRFSNASLFTEIKQSISLILKSNFLKFPLTILLTAALFLQFFLPHYWQYQFPAPSASVPTGVTTNGHPWIGAATPTLTIEEFTDYQCFQCAKMHHYLRRLVADNSDKIRLVHINYPMDHEVNPYIVPEPFHVGSARLALLSIAAHDQGKFWEVNDAIFEVMRKKNTEINIREIAERAQADPDSLAQTIYKKETIKKLEEDIRTGLRYKITGTPAFVINGKLYLGNLPNTLFEQIKK
jgi:protein-disulfide isomerase/uncharacterized membrane protein